MYFWDQEATMKSTENTEYYHGMNTEKSMRQLFKRKNKKKREGNQ